MMLPILRKEERFSKTPPRNVLGATHKGAVSRTCLILEARGRVDAYKRFKGRTQPKRGTSPRPPDSAAPLTGPNFLQKFQTDYHGDKPKIAPFSALPTERNRFHDPSTHVGSHMRTFSSTTSQTAPVLQGSQQDLSPLKTLDLPVYTKNGVGGTSSSPRQRLPEQCHSRGRASYGGSSSSSTGGNLFSGGPSSNPIAPPEEAFRSPISSDSNLKISVSSPVSNGFYSPDNFNIIKSMDAAKKQLYSALLQSKESVLRWWVQETTKYTRLPMPPSPMQSPVGEVDVGTSTDISPSPKLSAPASSNHELTMPSLERDENDLIECMFDFLIDAINGGESLQSLNRLLKLAIRNCTTTVKSKPQHAQQLGNQSEHVSTSFTFDEVQPSCEVSFIKVVSRIIQQQQQLQEREQGEKDPKNNSPSPVDMAIKQVIAFIEKAWYSIHHNLPFPLRDGGHSQPHQMLTWIKLITEFAEEAIDQIPLEGKPILRRTKTIGAGQNLNFTSERERVLRVQSYIPPILSFSTASSSVSASASPWVSSPYRQVQLKSPHSSPDGLYLQDSLAPINPHSSVESQLAAAESDDVVRIESSQMAQSELMVRRTMLKRNAHPLKYIKRVTAPVNGEALPPKEDYKSSLQMDLDEVHDLKRLNSQIVEELKEVTRSYNQLLRQELDKKELYITALERLAVLGVGDDSHVYTGISSGFPSLSKWLSDLGIPVGDIEIITAHHFDQNDFLELITKEDLWRLHLKGGSVLRIWGAVSALRRKFLSGNQAEGVDGDASRFQNS
ncbi:unnamed protein product [Rodentolepis nana]|uniref:SAM domain-containing protein n=1 Tax=Rodentolepis nana TaxID=102285 RepID=A0A158QIP3_RODNA|nr:unnamed protein product [Rodentolepis nana]